MTDDDLWRVYRPEWVTVHTVAARTDDPNPEGLIREAMEIFRGVYAGRVRDDEVRVVTVDAGRFTRVQLQLLLPAMKGEFITADLARTFAASEGLTGVRVVARNSRDDHDLRGYGVRKLADR